MNDIESRAPALSLEGISQRFHTALALDDVSFSARAGTVHALLGENGAGKTTLMRVAFGLLAPQRGEVRLHGTVVRMTSPAFALASGIGMVQQHFSLVPAMTVAENVSLGSRGLFDPVTAAERVRVVSAKAGLVLDPHAVVRTLSVGAQQRCEIVKALSRNVQVLILDEPTAVLAPREATELLHWIRAFADAGNAVVLITHKLRDALAIADEVTVLRRGRSVMSTRARDTGESALTVAMFGEQSTNARTIDARGTPSRAIGAPDDVLTAVLSAVQVSLRDARGVTRVRDASLHVRAGEIVGLAAIEGAGQRELLRLLAGRLVADAGQLRQPTSIGFVPEDRHGDALILDASLVENVALRDASMRRGRMPWHALRDATAAIIARFDVRAPSAAVAARTLSGGNQQKLVLGRELVPQPQALVVENPSRGLDFRATLAVHAALRSARDTGSAVLLYSSDLDEVLALADRVYAMHEGLVTEVVRDRDVVGRAMLRGAST